MKQVNAWAGESGTLYRSESEGRSAEATLKLEQVLDALPLESVMVVFRSIKQNPQLYIDIARGYID